MAKQHKRRGRERKDLEAAMLLAKLPEAEANSQGSMTLFWGGRGYF